MSSNQTVASNQPLPTSPQDSTNRPSRPASTGKPRSKSGHSNSKGRESMDGAGKLKDQGSAEDESEDRYRSQGNHDGTCIKPPRRHKDGDVEGFQQDIEGQSGKEDAGGKHRASKDIPKRRSPVENPAEEDPINKKSESSQACDPSVCSWLNELGLQQYISLFAAHHVSFDLLSELNMEALEAIGISSWGHRCLILKTLASRRKAAEEMPSTEEDPSARQGAGKQKSNAKERSGGFGLALNVAGPQADASNAHDNLKDVYEQMENMKMHFEAQMEQLNRELMVDTGFLVLQPPDASVQAAKNELTSLKGVLNASNTQPAGNGNVHQKGSRSSGGEGDSSSHRRGNNPGKTNKGPRKEHVDNMMSGEGYGYAQSQMSGAMSSNANFMRQLAQNMAYGQPIYAGMMPSSAQQFFYGNLGMVQGYEGYDPQYYMQTMMQAPQQNVPTMAVAMGSDGSFDSGHAGAVVGGSGQAAGQGGAEEVKDGDKAEQA